MLFCVVGDQQLADALSFEHLVVSVEQATRTTPVIVAALLHGPDPSQWQEARIVFSDRSTLETAESMAKKEKIRNPVIIFSEQMSSVQGLVVLPPEPDLTKRLLAVLQVCGLEEPETVSLPKAVGAEHLEVANVVPIRSQHPPNVAPNMVESSLERERPAVPVAEEPQTSQYHQPSSAPPYSQPQPLMQPASDLLPTGPTHEPVTAPHNVAPVSAPKYQPAHYPPQDPHPTPIQEPQPQYQPAPAQEPQPQYQPAPAQEPQPQPAHYPPPSSASPTQPAHQPQTPAQPAAPADYAPQPIPQQYEEPTPPQHQLPSSPVSPFQQPDHTYGPAPETHTPSPERFQPPPQASPAPPANTPPFSPASDYQPANLPPEPEPQNFEPSPHETPQTQTPAQDVFQVPDRPQAHIVDSQFPATPWLENRAAQSVATRQGEVFCVCAAKGGVGKSTTSLWLAEALNKLGRKTVLVDGNVAQPDLMTTLGVYSEDNPGLAGLVKPRGQRYAPSELERMLVEINGVGSVLPGPPRPIKVDQDPVLQALANAVQDLKSQFDFVVVDTPVAQAYEMVMFNMVKPLADFVVLLCTPHVPTANDTRKWLELACTPLEKGGLEMEQDKFVGLITRAADATEEVTVENLIEWLPALNIVASIPKIDDVNAKQNRAQWKCPPQAQPGIMQLVDVLTGGQAVPEVGRQPKTSDSKKRSKMFGRKKNK